MMQHHQNNSMEKRQSSLRSLKELQQRKKMKSILNEQQQMLQSQHNRQDFKTQMDGSFHSQRDMSHLLNHTVGEIASESGSKRKMHIEDEKSNGGMRKRSPSDFLRRKSTPVTPKKGQVTVPNVIDQNSQSLMAKTYIRNRLNLSTVNPNTDINIFPSLSQTPKFDIKGVGQSLAVGPKLNIKLEEDALVPPNKLMDSTRQKRSSSRSYIILDQQKSQSRIRKRSAMPGGQAWQKQQANQFLIRDSEPNDVLKQLQSSAALPIQLSLAKPNDLDSTEPLDSFLEQIFVIIEEQIKEYTKNFQDKQQHLASGVRTDYCEDIMDYLCQLQGRNRQFIDSVEYFAQYIQKLGQLEQTKEENDREIKQLKKDKEEYFLQRYDLDRKLAETSMQLEKSEKTEADLRNQLKVVTKKFEQKRDECESLQFRIKNMDELSVMMEPPNTSIAAMVSGDAGSAAYNQAFAMINDDKMRGLEVMNKKLEYELDIVKKALQEEQESKFTDNVDHFVKIQELFNKVQADNKQLRIMNTKLESKLESKEKLVNHLEQKVTSIMIEKEEIIVKLKSDLVILKHKVEQQDKTFNTKIAQETQKIEDNLSGQYKQRIIQLEGDVEVLKKVKEDQHRRISQLQQDYDQLANDFENYRNDTNQRSAETADIIKDLQAKLAASYALNEQQTKTSTDKIASLDNQIACQVKQISIMQLKINFIKDSMDQLIKQKQFILENITKSQEHLKKEAQRVEDNIAKENPQSQDYLISVKKAVKQSQGMAAIGEKALLQVSEIVEFLKLEDVMKMIKTGDAKLQILQQRAEPREDQQDYNVNEIQRLNDEIRDHEIKGTDVNVSKKQKSGQMDTIKVKQQFTQNKESQQAHIQPVQGLQLKSFGMINRMPEILTNNMDSDRRSDEIVRNENYYMVYCPLELASICIKTLAEVYCLSQGEEYVSSLDIEMESNHVPEQMQNLMHLVHQRSDSSIEQEILHKYLSSAKKALEDKINSLNRENQKLKLRVGQDQKIEYEHSRTRSVEPFEEDKGEQIPMKPILLEGFTKNIDKRKSHAVNLNLGQFQLEKDQPAMGDMTNQELQPKSQVKRKSVLELFAKVNNKPAEKQTEALSVQKKSPANRSGSTSPKSKGGQHVPRKNKKQEALQIAQNEIENLKLTIQELKLKHKEIQMALASKYVLLEERLDLTTSDREAHLHELEEIHKQELEKTKIGIQQREQHLLFRLQDFKERNQQYEEVIGELKGEIHRLKRDLQRIEVEKREFDNELSKKVGEFAIYKENVSTYINMKVSQRGCFGIALEVNNSNLSMVNEAMLKFYLNKCLSISKDKFRFLCSEEQVYSNSELIKTTYEDGKSIAKKQNDSDSVTVAKLIIEIIDDQDNIDKYFSLLKRQIKEGTSLLYDLSPLYLSINLGQVGLSSTKLLTDFHIVKKKGVIVKDEEFMVTVLRHRIDALTFKVIAINFELGDEYVLDLRERDLFEMTEGCTYLLEQEEPSELIDLIVANLVIVSKEQGLKVMSCEHKVFFNQLFHEKLQSSSERKVKTDNYLSEIPFRTLTLRNQQVQQIVESQTKKIKPEFSQFINCERGCQTEVDSSLAHEYSQVYQGNQKLGRALEFKIIIYLSQRAERTTMSFEEIRSKQKVQVSFFKQSNSVEANQYIIYSECLRISPEHVILLSAEKIQTDGFLVKLHDLRELASEEFFLVRKSNNQFSKLNRSAGLDLVVKEEFRNLVFDLTFAVNIPSSQVLIANMAYETSPGKNNEESIDSNEALPGILQVPTRKRNSRVKKLAANHINKLHIFPVTHALPKDQVTILRHERGELLYRNVFIVRCIFEGTAEVEQQSIISFYQKKDQISVEVFLYKDNQKMSIASQVTTFDLFGQDSANFTFSQKIEQLDQMMEKLFVISENQSYHLKVENDATPISTILEARREHSSSVSASIQSVDRAEVDKKLKDIQHNREEILADNKTQVLESYSVINNKVYNYKVWFLLKPKKEMSTENSPKKKHSLMKRPQERQTTNLEALIEDSLDFENIFVEVTDKGKEMYQNLITQKILIHLLTCNPQEYQNNLSLASNKNKDQLVEYLKKNTKIQANGSGKMALTIESYQDVQMVSNPQEFYSKQLGGQYHQRDERFFNLKSEDVKKQLIINHETEMSEFVYDIKVYQVVLVKEKSLISYCVEMFSLNEPDVFYLYNYPMAKCSVGISAPIYLSYDIVNLIDPKEKDAIDPLAEKKANFQQLFSKYIDNRIVLLFSEQLFPQKVSICFIEPSSKLQWSYSFDPSDQQDCLLQNKLDLSQISLMDQMTMEQFLSLVLCQIENSKKLEVAQFENVEGIWEQTGDLDSKYDLVKGKVIEQIDLAIKISKQGAHSLIVRLDSKGGVASSLNLTKQKEQENLEIRLDTRHREKVVCKLLQRKNNEDNKLMLAVEMVGGIIRVKVIDIGQRKVLYQYRFKDKNLEEKQSSQELPLAEALAQGFGSIFGTQIGEASFQYFQRYYAQKVVASPDSSIFFDSFSVSQRRMLANKGSQKKTVILHRKTYFDEAQEKLIIMFIKIDTQMSAAAQTMPQDVNFFTMVISEPETEIAKKNEYKLALESCFHEDELVNLNRRDINQLKKFARVLIEERAVVKRANDIPANSAEQNLYSVEINLGASMGTGIAGPNPQNNPMATQGSAEAQSPSDQFDEAKRMMEEMRKANNISAGGKRKIGKDINEIEEENEEDDEDQFEDHAPVQQQQLPSHMSPIRALEQTIIEEVSQEEEIESPPKSIRDISEQNDSLSQGIHSISNQQHSILNQQMSRAQSQIVAEENDEDYEMEGDEIEDDDDRQSSGNISNTSRVYTRKLPRDLVLEIFEVKSLSQSQAQNGGRILFIARQKRMIDNSEISRFDITEDKVKQIITSSQLRSPVQQSDLHEALYDYLIQSNIFM